MLLTVISTVAPINTGEQITATDWLNVVYNHQPLPTAETMRHTDGFCHTRTYEVTQYDNHATVFPRMKRTIKALGRRIQAFKETYDCTDMQQHYDTFCIPKRSGGMREINAPKPYLMELMRLIQTELEHVLQLRYHDRAYAYCKGRSIKDALIVHQNNESKWFLKLDLKDFFPSCSGDFIKAQLRHLYPFLPLYEDAACAAVLDEIIELSLLHNGLPQGTPLSPMWTNLIMLPIDHRLTKVLWNIDGKHFEYTRYADDILISCKYDFDWRVITEVVRAALGVYEAPFTIKDSKTRYGSSAGRNWNLGLMLNKDNNITLGHKQKMRLRAGINNFLRDFTSGNFWDIMDVYRLQGNLSHLHSIEPEYCDYIIQELNSKYNTNFKDCAKRIINGDIPGVRS